MKDSTNICETFLDRVALDRYPIDCLNSLPGKRLVKRCKQQIALQGVFSLPGFLTDKGIADCLSLAHAAAPSAYYSSDRHNPIFSKEDYSSFPTEHPWRHSDIKQIGYIANDLIPPDSVLQRLSDWPAMSNFVAATLGYDRLYPLSDSLGALSINIMRDGGCLGWHFDTNDFIVALPLQLASEGGVYEYCPNIWDRESGEWQAVTDAMNGDRRLVKSLPYSPGSLVVFCGRYSLHRVTKVIGSKSRMVALLAYHHAPNKTLSRSVRMHIYGRDH